VEVAGHGLNPGIGDTDQGLRKIFGSKADGSEHRTRARAVTAFGDKTAAVL
jgi:hypothetical protein